VLVHLFAQIEIGELTDTAAVAERGIEHRNSTLLGRSKVYLIRANTEAAHRHEILRLGQDLSCEAGLAPYPHNVGIPDLLLELSLREGLGIGLNLISLPLKELNPSLVDTLKQEHLGKETGR